MTAVMRKTLYKMAAYARRQCRVQSYSVPWRMARAALHGLIDVVETPDVVREEMAHDLRMQKLDDMLSEVHRENSKLIEVLAPMFNFDTPLPTITHFTTADGTRLPLSSVFKTDYSEPSEYPLYSAPDWNREPIRRISFSRCVRANAEKACMVAGCDGQCQPVRQAPHKENDGRD